MNDINKKIRVIISSGEQKMKEIIAFFKDIFMLSDESSMTKIGLAQFKEENISKPQPKKVKKVEKEIKLSDLMRRSA